MSGHPPILAAVKRRRPILRGRLRRHGLSIQDGDTVGIDYTGALSVIGNLNDASIMGWTPELVDNDPARNFNLALPFPRQVRVNADIEPDADGDGFGDETQDQCPTDASTHGPCGGGGDGGGGGEPTPDDTNDISFGKVRKNKRKGERSSP
jgi:hypothetical protein